MNTKIDLHQTVLALSEALDLVGVDGLQHGKRVAYMMVQGCSGLPPILNETEMFQLGMLHDIGVSSTETHQYLVKHLAWEGAEEHCDVGFHRLMRFAPLVKLAPYVLHHHTRWDEYPSLGVPPDVALIANWVFLTDRVDVMAAGHYAHDILEKKEEIIAKVGYLKGRYFAPELVELFLRLSGNDAFWLDQEPRHLVQFLQNEVARLPLVDISYKELKSLAQIFAEIVDTKSQFTHEHSLGVARLAKYLAVQFKVDSENIERIEIAGLLHDLGKLQTPDEILDKPGPLDEGERARLNHHSYETFQILHKITGLEDVANWAALHHESPNGKGYPFQRKGGDLPIEARIIAVADVFQALVQNRPYRVGLPDSKVRQIILDFAATGKLDSEIASWVAERVEICRPLAQ